MSLLFYYFPSYDNIVSHISLIEVFLWKISILLKLEIKPGGH